MFCILCILLNKLHENSEAYKYIIISITQVVLILLHCVRIYCFRHKGKFIKNYYKNECPMSQIY